MNTCVCVKLDVKQKPAQGSSWWSTTVDNVPSGLSNFSAAMYKVEVLRNRLSLVRAQIAKRNRELAAAEQAIEKAYESMEDRYGTYMDLFHDLQRGDRSASDPHQLLTVGRSVASAQDRHFGLTTAWMGTSGQLTNEIVVLERRKQRLEEAIGQLQSDLATQTMDKAAAQKKQRGQQIINNASNKNATNTTSSK